MSLGVSDSYAALYREDPLSDTCANPIPRQASPGSEIDIGAERSVGLPHADCLGIALIGPDDHFQEQLFRPLALSLYAVRQLQYYPTLDQVSAIAALGHSVFIIDLDSDARIALNLVEGFSRIANAVVVVTSSSLSIDLVIRAVRAGAREILPLPLTREQLDEAMTRARSRISATSINALGRLCVFIGAKGGSGTTTVASNFALSTALASGKRVLLIDFDLPLGDAVLNFGMQPEFSTMDALESHQRLDATLLKRYIARHDSGLFILAAQGKYARCPMTKEAIDRLILVARQEFECVVLDAGTRFDLTDTAIFHTEAQIYLVSQVSIPDLRNANRILSQIPSGGRARNVQVVLNRDSVISTFDNEQVAKALTQAVRWRVPNDFKAVRDMQASGVPLVMKDSAVAQAIRQMARAGLELPGEPEKKRKVLGLF